MQPTINYWAVLVAAVINMVLGGLWYSKLLFAKPWMKAMKLTDEELEELGKGANKAYALSALSALVMSYILAHIVDFTGATNYWLGAETGFWSWLGFVATTGSASVLFEGRAPKLYFINAGYYLVALMLMGALLAVWV